MDFFEFWAVIYFYFFLFASQAGLKNRQLDTVDFYLKSKENILNRSGDEAATSTLSLTESENTHTISQVTASIIWTQCECHVCLNVCAQVSRSCVLRWTYCARLWKTQTVKLRVVSFLSSCLASPWTSSARRSVQCCPTRTVRLHTDTHRPVYIS